MFYKNIKSELSDKTILFITHKLKGIKEADKIILINNGKLIDIGRHEELYNRCTMYSNLYNMKD